MDLRNLYNKYKDIIPYLFFGVCTTLTNVFSYWFCAHLFKIPVMPSTIIAWIIAVLFAYFTNRKWVFHSKATGPSEIVREVIMFFSCRLATGLVDWLVMFLFVKKLSFNDVIIKFSANVLVIILNYVASKLLIFKEKGGSRDDKIS